MQNPRAAISILEERLKEVPSDFQARITLGEAYQLASQPARAEEEFRAALQIHPGQPEALLALGSLYNQQRKFEAAQHLLRKAAESGQNETAHFQWAFALAGLHRYREAAAALRPVHPPEPTEQRIAYQRLKASIDLGNGKARSAAEDMEEALRLSPHDGGLIVSAGVAEAQAKHWQQAISLLQPSFQSNPNPVAGVSLLQAQVALKQDTAATLQTLHAIHLPTEEAAPLYFELARILADGGLHRQAAFEFQAGAALAPAHSDALFNLALEQYRSGQMDAALATAERAKGLGDSAELEDLKGDVQEARADYVAAAECYQRAVALAPKDERYRLSLGMELLKHESFEPALVVFKQAAGLFPDSVRMRVALGMTYFFLERYAEASEALTQAVSLERKSDLALRYLGMTQLDQPVAGRSPAVKPLCQRADAHPDDGSAVTYCAALLLREAVEAGDKSQSREILRRLTRAVKLSPMDSLANCQLGKALEWIGQWEEARSQMEKCVRLQPDSAENHYRLGQVYQHLGLPELARQQFELHEAARREMSEDVAHREASVKHFLYDLQGGTKP
jgi:tetratricopeptide (TPR) repeat protein